MKIYYAIKRRFSNLCFHIRKQFNLPSPTDFKYVDLVFENCNTVRIPARFIENLVIIDIRKDVFTNFCQQYIEIDYCNEFSITVKSEAIGIKTHFQKEFKDDKISTFERHIKLYKDVTHIEIKPNKGKRIYIGVPYEAESVFTESNLLQENKFEKDTFTISCKRLNPNVPMAD